uniref:Putative 2-ketogluconate reductase n=1 Tax=Lygus hesperus TaxID=30085 RepID=A0A0A9Z453_LYGHE
MSNLTILASCKLPPPIYETLKKQYGKVLTPFGLEPTGTDDPIYEDQQEVNEHNAEFQKLLSQADAIYGRLKITRDMIEKAPKLKIISLATVGFDYIDMDAATEHKVVVCNIPGVTTDTTADLSFSLLMAAARRICQLDKYVRDNGWKDFYVNTSLYGHNIAHQTLGMIGFGNIGSAVARRGHFGFNMKI